MESRFTSVPAGSGRSGVVTELFARLVLIAVGAMFLAVIIFSTVPRPRLSAWRGEARKTVTTVGFTDQIEAGATGRNHREPAGSHAVETGLPGYRPVYPMREDVYLRGSVVTSYSHNQWRRNSPEQAGPGDDTSDTTFHVGPPVEQQMTLEPNLYPDDVFYIWPLIEPVAKDLAYSPPTGRLLLRPNYLSGELRSAPGAKSLPAGWWTGIRPELIPASGGFAFRPICKCPAIARPCRG